MHWQRLDRDNAIKVIESVKSEENAGLFSAGTSEVKRARLAFYKEYALYKMTNYASLPSFSFEYLSDGTFFHYLDGTESPIYTVNDKGVLQLDKHNILAYLRFFFEHVGGEEGGDIIIIDNPHDMPLLDSLGPASYDAIFNHHKAPEISHDSNLDSYEIEANLYKESQMIRAKIEVSAKGRVKIKDQKMIMHEVLDSGASQAIL